MGAVGRLRRGLAEYLSDAAPEPPDGSGYKLSAGAGGGFLTQAGVSSRGALASPLNNELALPVHNGVRCIPWFKAPSRVLIV